MDAKHMDALRELEIAALRGHPDGYATSDCTVTHKEAADALRAALARIHELETALRSVLTAWWGSKCRRSYNGADLEPIMLKANEALDAHDG